MTPEEIRDICDLLTAAGRTHVPVPISEWREYMSTKSIGRATVKTDATGKAKLSVPDTTPKHFKQAKRAKASRKASGLVKNREAKR
mgnify:CR=1 FL=1